MKKSPHIVIVGAGAVGGITAAILHREGYATTLVTKHQDLAKKISTIGIHISGSCGTFSVRMPAVATIKEVKKDADYVLIATKSTDLPLVAKEIKANMGDQTLVVSMQNGVVEEELADIVGADRTIGCVVGWGATMTAPGELVMTSTGEFVIGYINKPIDERLKELQSILQFIHPTIITDKIYNHLYSKLIINACISTMGGVSGLLLGEMLKKKIYRKIFIQIIKEAIDVANEMNLDVVPYADKLNYYKFLKNPPLMQHFVLRAFGHKYRRLKSSALQSLERGKKTEVNNFNGYIAMKGIKHNVPTPFNSRLTAIVQEIELKKLKITEDNLKQLQSLMK